MHRGIICTWKGIGKLIQGPALCTNSRMFLSCHVGTTAWFPIAFYRSTLCRWESQQVSQRSDCGQRTTDFVTWSSVFGFEFWNWIPVQIKMTFFKFLNTRIMTLFNCLKKKSYRIIKVAYLPTSVSRQSVTSHPVAWILMENLWIL